MGGFLFPDECIPYTHESGHQRLDLLAETERTHRVTAEGSQRDCDADILFGRADIRTPIYRRGNAAKGRG
jgi:hypothetical protein